MKPIELSDEQRQAILTPGNVVVRAAAGSGKTEVLARRFVALVAGDISGTDPLSPERIAAITFTEKATHDMTERIANVLDERLAAARGTQLERHLKQSRRMLPLARISTIHAFCARILRENPIEAGIDPDFEVLDEYESATFLQRNCEKLLIEAVRNGDAGAVWLVEARGLRASSAYREGALEIVLRILCELDRLGKNPAWLLEAAELTAKEISAVHGEVRERAMDLKRLLEELMAESGLTPKAAERIAVLKAQWPRYRSLLDSFDAEADPSALDILREICDAIPAAQGKSVKDRVKAVRELLDKKNNGVRVAGTLVETYGLQRAARPITDVAAVIAHIGAHLENIKRRDGVLTFGDLLVRTLDLFNEKPGVTRKLRSAISALLVDEYQDTDPIQDRIIRKLTESSAADSAPARYLVGDEKQSIYRFRGADVTVFKRLGADNLKTLGLRGNRRAAPNIIALINALGESVMRSESGPAADHWVEWSEEDSLRPMRTASGSEATVEIIVTNSERGANGASTAEKRDFEARVIANRIRELLRSEYQVIDLEGGLPRPARFGDIAILMRAFTDVEIYETALREAGIDCYTVKGRGFFGCREVLDLADLLGAIEDPRDGIALAAALRSPFFGLSDQCLLEIGLHIHEARAANPNHAPVLLAGLFSADEPGFQWLTAGRDEAVGAWRVLNELRAMREHASIVEIIERAFTLTGFEAVMLGQSQGRQHVANLRKLVELAREFESRRYFGFADFIAHLRRLTSDPPHQAQAQILGENEDVVRLMTIHQAKGLEFPIVIVADMGRRPRGDNATFVLSPKRGLIACDVAGSGRDEIPNRMLNEHREAIRDQEAAEAARLLYVAVTRARDLLILSEGANINAWAAKLRALVGTDRISAFSGGGEQQIFVDVGEAKVSLRRAESLAAYRGEAEKVAGGASVAVHEDIDELVRARLSFSPAEAKELVATPTELSDFERCPRQYLFRHRLTIPETNTYGAADGALAIEMGIVAHAALERLVAGGAEAIASGEIERAVNLLSAGTSIGPAERAAIARDLDRYLEQRSLACEEEIAGREAPFFLHVGENGPTLFIRGQIDVLAEDGDTIVVRDYKYSRAAEEGSAYQLQMECYALAAAEAYPGHPVRAELVFLRDRTERREVPLPSSEHIRSHLLEVGRQLFSAGTSNDYPKKPSERGLCQKLRCGYVQQCWAR